MNRLRIERLLAEAGLDPVESTDIVDALAPLADLADRAPAPSRELSAVFARTAQAGRPAPLSARSRSTLAGVVVLALSGVGATGLSAAANTLPRPFQHQVSEFSRHYLPFDLPEPPGREPRPAVDAGSTHEADAGAPDTGATATQSVPGRVDGHPTGGSGTSGSEAERPGVQEAGGSRPDPHAGQGTASDSPGSGNHSLVAEADEPSSPSGSATTEKSGHQRSARDRSDDDVRSDDEKSGDQKPGKDRERASGKNHEKQQGKDHDKQQGNDKGSGPSPEPGNGPGEGHEDDGGGQQETPPPETPEPDLPLPDVVPDDVPGGGPTPGG